MPDVAIRNALKTDSHGLFHKPRNDVEIMGILC